MSDMDDWVDSEDELDSDSDGEKKKKDSDDEVTFLSYVLIFLFRSIAKRNIIESKLVLHTG